MAYGRPAEDGKAPSRMSAEVAAWCGVWVVDKPHGLTSFDVIRELRRWTGRVKMGHTGTLDPIATGVLPVLVGSATKLLGFLSLEPKKYRGRMVLGLVTDSWDITGKVVSQQSAQEFAASRIESLFTDLQGVQFLEPPAYSAIKHKGRPLYTYARKGAPIVPASRAATIRRLALLDYRSGVLDFEVVCSRGTYVRSIAQEVGRRLGCGACLGALRRLECGPFRVEDARSLAELKALHEAGRMSDALIPPQQLLSHLHAAEVDEEAERKLRLGNSVRGEAARAIELRADRIGEKVCLHAGQRLVAIAEVQVDPKGFLLQPVRVLD